jgi:adenylate cyclase
MRITAQLLEAATGKYLWAERYDRGIEDLFDVQDEITQMIVASLPAHVDEAERTRVLQRASESFSAYDHWLRGKHLLSGNRSKDEVLRARHHFETAIELDPGFGSAYVELADTYHAEYDSAWSKSHEAALEQVLKLGHQAVDADPRDSRTHLYLAWGYLNVRGDYELAKVQVDEALALNPNDYYNYCFGGWLAACSGDLNRAVACSNEAVRRSPIVSDGCLETRVAAEYLAGNYAESIAAFGKMLRPRGVVYGWIAAAYAQLGRAGEARAMADEFRSRVQRLPRTPKDDDPAEWRRFWDTDFRAKDSVAREHFFAGLRKAGLPV